MVSVLFADLVGFTAIAEPRDPEEVREILSTYFDRMRAAVERHGGVVEKFIGDAVMAVWGAPVAHEDDAERAVRAGLAMVDGVAQMNGELDLAPGTLALRVGVLTGEAAVTIGAQAQGMVAGDLVNTASRLQSAAPPGSVLVGEATRRATEAAISYRAGDELQLKGKTAPVPAWVAERVVAARRGHRRIETLDPPFVGRDGDLRLVRDLFHGAAEQRRTHLVEVSGIAGIGKSRLSWEFEKYADGLAETVLWHRGRCLAYGEGVTYWALAEMVRMRAGIAEEEPDGPALEKLRAELAARIPEPDVRAWVERPLAHLVGLEAGPAPAADELFAAWRLFFERLAAASPVVMVFEDLQWADPNLLDFIDHLLEWSRSHPLFILALTRPELAERRPSWTAGKHNATSLHLEPLVDRAMDELIAGLVPGIPDDLGRRIRERAEGVPLYAVETVRMLLDRGAISRDGDGYRLRGPVEQLDVPETLHALIAARLDGLEPRERQVLADASVLGKTFTERALRALTGLDGSGLDPILRSLMDKELLFVQSDPRSPERGQYGFLQALVREITYGTLARRDRKARHLAAAEYLETDRLTEEEEIVEVVASHYLEAYAADPNASDAEEIRSKARGLLVRAGDRAASLAAPAQAVAHFERALELADDPLEQASLLEKAGDSAAAAGDLDRAETLLDRSAERYEAGGRPSDAARVSARLAEVLWDRGRIEEGLPRMERSFAVLSEEEPDEAFAWLAAQIGRFHFFMGEMDVAMERLEVALAIAERLYLPVVLSHALNTKSLVLNVRGRPEEARALLRHALTVAQDVGDSQAIMRAYYNLYLEPLDEVLDHARRGLDMARRLGHRQWELNFLGRLVGCHWLRGEWSEAAAVAEPLLDPANWQAGSFAISRVLPSLVHLHLNRGERETAERLLEIRREAASSAGLLERADYLTALAMATRTAGDLETARRAREEIVPILGRMGIYHETTREAAAEAVEICIASGELDLARELLHRFRAVVSPPNYLRPHLARLEAKLAAAAGERDEVEERFERAVGMLREAESRFVLAVALLDFGDWLVGEGRAEEAGPMLAEAREIFEQLAARPWLERVSASFGQAVTATQAAARG